MKTTKAYVASLGTTGILVGSVALVLVLWQRRRRDCDAGEGDRRMLPWPGSG